MLAALSLGSAHEFPQERLFQFQPRDGENLRSLRNLPPVRRITFGSTRLECQLSMIWGFECVS